MQVSIDRDKFKFYKSATITDISVEDFAALQTALKYHTQYMLDNNYHTNADPEIRAMYDRAADLLDALTR